MQLLHGDCLDLLPTLADDSVGAVICDPPYGRTAAAWDTLIPFAPLWVQLWRVLRPGGAVVLFAQQPFTAALVMSQVARFVFCWSWDKNNSAGYALVKRRPFPVIEDICVFADGDYTYHPQMIKRGPERQKGYAGQCSASYRIVPTKGGFNDLYYPKSLIQISKVNQRERLHENQKPLPLMAYLVRTHSDPGDMVLDFAMGSGSTGVAALAEGRDFVGIERDAKIFRLARERILTAERSAVLTERTSMP